MIARWRDGVFHGWWIVAADFSLETLIGTLMFHAYGAYSTGLGATAALALVRYQARHQIPVERFVG